MADDTKAALRIAVLLAVGLGPSLALLVVAPSPAVALAAAGSAAMAIAFVAWSFRLISAARRATEAAAEARGKVDGLERTIQSQASELREARRVDPATGALTRGAFLRRLDEAIHRDGRLDKPLAFLLVELERMKGRGTRGPSGGDSLLRRVAHALEDATRGTDFVGRLDGDKFGLVLNECGDPGPAVNRIFDGLSGAGKGSAQAIHVAVGAVTVDEPATGVDLHELFRLAESALGSVRGTGGSLCARRTLSRAVAAGPPAKEPAPA
jgi:diguanylate cyclase (GGDEF)-like protein